MLDFHKLPRLALQLQLLTTRLLQPQLDESARANDLPLLERPVSWAEYRTQWLDEFRDTGGAQARLVAAGVGMVEQLWAAQGTWCGTRSYEAVETWLRTKTLTVAGYRPVITLQTLWYATAAHNWLWWCQHGGRPGEPISEDCLKNDVDPFLDWLERPDPAHPRRSLQLGDLVAMYLMAVNVGRLAQRSAATLRGEQKKRLRRIQTISPLARLAAVYDDREAPYLSCELGGNWLGINTLVDESAAAGIRQYLTSRLGARAAEDSEQARKQVLQVMDALRRHADADPIGREGYLALLAQTLRATFSEGTAEAYQQVWSAWCWGYPERESLAKRCGQLARWCEADAQSRRGDVTTEAQWLWRELAQTTLPRWLAGDARGLLCLGLWLQGYLEDADEQGAVPRLVLARQVGHHSLERLISTWNMALPRARQRGRGLSGGDQVLTHLAAVRRELEANPAYDRLLREHRTLQFMATLSRALPSVSPHEPSSAARINPNVTAYCHPTPERNAHDA